MGNDTSESVSKSSFEFQNVIGKGSFGKVWKVYHPQYKQTYAMKEMSKVKIIEKKMEPSIKTERDFLSRMDHPFIINMQFAFQDKDNLYLGMDYLKGGDLRYHLRRCSNKTFTEEQTKFFTACLLMSLEYIHTNKIIHRDLKPENLVLDSNGYLKLTDFGTAILEQKNSKQIGIVGTPGYIAPEVFLSNKGLTIASDYFGVGIIVYEFMKGIRPYSGLTLEELKDKIMQFQACIKPKDIPNDYSDLCADFVNKLIQKNPTNRLGSNGPNEVKNHPWFKDFNWRDLYNFKIKAPFLPKAEDNVEHEYVDAQVEIPNDLQEKYKNILGSSGYKTAFQDYLFFNRHDFIEEDDENKDGKDNKKDAKSGANKTNENKGNETKKDNANNGNAKPKIDFFINPHKNLEIKNKKK